MWFKFADGNANGAIVLSHQSTSKDGEGIHYGESTGSAQESPKTTVVASDGILISEKEVS